MPNTHTIDRELTMPVPPNESIRITHDQVEQLAAWIGPEPVAEVVIARMIGAQGEGLYAYNPDDPERVVFLDSLAIGSPRIYTVQQLYGRQITGETSDLANAAAKIFFDFQAAECMGLVPVRPSMADVRKAIAESPDALFFHPWTNSDVSEERLIASGTFPNKSLQIRQVFTRLDQRRQAESLAAKNMLRATYVKASIAPEGTV
ncbi:hypothetical protein JWH16_04440 [Xanthomonas campestris pv. campestris]|uniref:hypothetical protein n=1 Tax=Xanthomonas campestris TaxID=339 RepID=UPI001E3E23D2|nr:hypothetical protein [Xanthomonas campestris]MCD0253103.1 hypothetical protein [Xanthomonas campestris pv. campestris]